MTKETDFVFKGESLELHTNLGKVGTDSHAMHLAGRHHTLAWNFYQGPQHKLGCTGNRVIPVSPQYFPIPKWLSLRPWEGPRKWKQAEKSFRHRRTRYGGDVSSVYTEQQSAGDQWLKWQEEMEKFSGSQGWSRKKDHIAPILTVLIDKYHQGFI